MFFFSFTQEIPALENVNIPADSLRLVATDSIPADSSKVKKVTIPKKTVGDIKTTIDYKAKDSIYFDVNNRQLFLYGKTSITYGDIKLDANKTEVDWRKKIIKSDYSTDSTGKKIGKPIFTDKGQVYETNQITYNFLTRRALIKGVVTEQEGGYLHGQVVKKNTNDELYVSRARYTTCNLEHPHFFIESRRVKVIPKSKIVSGPFSIKFRDLPTPIFLPFGMFPQPKKRASGIIMPKYGEERRRGFFLRGGGYYFAISDYIDLRVTGDIYSKGGSGLDILTNYKKRYKFNGSLSYSVINSKSDDIDNPINSSDIQVRWTHTPETRGNSYFSANVDFQTSSYNQNKNVIADDYNRSINPIFTSNISYTNQLKRMPYNLSSNLRLRQNIRTKELELTLPELTLGSENFYPFKKLIKSPKSPLSQLQLRHTMNFENRISNITSNSTSLNLVKEQQKTQTDTAKTVQEILKLGKRGIRHNIPISTSFSVLKYFSITPSFNFTEYWYENSLKFSYDETQKALRIDTVRGFSRASNWSSSASLNTKIYGTKEFGRDSKIRAIRHILTPSLSFSYNPDFSNEKYGIYKEVQVDSTGRTQKLSKFEGSGYIYGSPSGSESKTVGFGIDNNLEMKVASKKDTVTGFKKIKLFNNFGLYSGYNIAADSFKLQNISFNTSSSFFNGKINFSANGSIDPYEYVLLEEKELKDGTRAVKQKRINKFAWNNGNGLGRLSSITGSVSFSLAPKPKNENEQNTQNSINTDNIDQNKQLNEFEKQQLRDIRNNPNEYVDFNMPWSMNVNYSITRSKQGFKDSQITQSLSFSGSLSLTPTTQISFSSSYDFDAREITSTNISASKDLHCWTMSFNWTPFGQFQNYFFTIRAKASLLQDLKLEKRRSIQDFFR